MFFILHLMFLPVYNCYIMSNRVGLPQVQQSMFNYYHQLLQPQGIHTYNHLCKWRNWSNTWFTLCITTILKQMSRIRILQAFESQYFSLLVLSVIFLGAETPNPNKSYGQKLKSRRIKCEVMFINNVELKCKILAKCI